MATFEFTFEINIGGGEIPRRVPQPPTLIPENQAVFSDNWYVVDAAVARPFVSGVG
jgi:hypothetical protein